MKYQIADIQDCSIKYTFMEKYYFEYKKSSCTLMNLVIWINNILLNIFLVCYTFVLVR